MKGPWGWIRQKRNKPCPKCETPITIHHFRSLWGRIQSGDYCPKCHYSGKW